MSDHAALDVLILAVLACVLTMGILSMFFKPAYEVGAYSVITALIALLSAAGGAKWGLSQPKPPAPAEPPK